MRRAWATFAVLAGLSGGLACQGVLPVGGADQIVKPSGEAPVGAEALEAAKARIEARRQQRLALEEGWKTGFTGEWRRAVATARDEGPPAFRKQVLAAWWPFAAGALILGFALRLLAAGRSAEARAAAGRTPGLLAPLLRVLIGKADGSGDAWPRALAAARDAERHLRLAGEAAHELAPTDPRGTRLAERLASWRDELAVLRRGLEDRGPFIAWLRDPAHLAFLDQTGAQAATLKASLVRAAVAAAPPDSGPAPEAAPTAEAWLEWDRAVNARPKTPVLRAAAATPGRANEWVRPLGLAGLGLTSASVLLVAGWIAAGAVPGVIAAVMSLVGLGALTVARTHLRVQDAPPLLPGPADALVQRLVLVVGVAAAVMLVSGSTDAESGLNLGAPPPLTDPAQVPVDEVPLALGLSAPPPTSPPPAAPALPPGFPGAGPRGSSAAP